MIGYSSVMLIGTLASEPKLHTTPGGTVVASLTVLVIRRRPHPNRPGHFIDQLTHTPVTAFNEKAQTIAKYAKLGGRRIFVDGHLEEQRNHPRHPAPLDVVVDYFNYLDALPGNSFPPEDSAPPTSERQP